MKRSFHHLVLTLVVFILLNIAACDLGQPVSSTTAGETVTSTLTFTPTDDTTVRARQPDLNFGEGPYLEVDAESRKDILLRFEISGVGSAEALDSAALRLFAVDASPFGGEIAVTGTHWRESNVSWDTAPPSEAPLGAFGAVEVGTWYELDVTPLLKGDGPVALRISSNNTNGADYASKEHPTGNAPELTVSLARPPGTDGETPSPPDNLRALLVEANRIELGWRPGADNVGVIGYDVYRDDSLLASIGAITFYQDISVAPGTQYFYAVRARDEAGNISTFSTLDVSTPIADDSVPNPDPDAVTFAAAGDFGGKDERAGTVMKDLKKRNAAAFLLLGDVTYNERAAQAWCDWVHSYLGSSYPMELLTGNHEDDARKDGFIHDFTACTPDRLDSVLGPGGYGVNYAFDLGPVTLLATAPDVTVDGTHYRFDDGSAEQQWLVATIRDAKLEDDWIVVGMHKVCITMGKKPCEIGEAFGQLLIDEKVDLVLQGHEHTYQRSHALAKLRAGGVPTGAIADEGVDKAYNKGAGTVFVIVGTAGRSLYRCSHTDPEAPYFAAHHCGEESASTKGYLLLEVSASQLEARFIPTVGTYSDAFSILR